MNLDKISYYIIVFLLLLSALQFSSFGIEGSIYEILRFSIILVIVILFLTSFRINLGYFRNIWLLRLHLFGIVLLLFIFIVLSPLLKNLTFSPIRDILLSFIILMIGVNLDLDEKWLKRLNFIYITLYTLAALSIVYKYYSGFIIKEQYLPIPKNQIAPAYSVALILSLYSGFQKRSHNKWYFYLVSLLLLLSLLVIRGRAALLAIFLSSILFVFYYIRDFKLRLIAIVAAILLIPFMGQMIFESIFLNYDVSDINSVSAGRWAGYIEGITFFRQHWAGGILEVPSLKNLTYNGREIHNYILFNLVNYGVFLCLVILLIYFAYIAKIFQSIRKNNFEYYEVGPLVLLIVFIVSLFEYTYPFAPGSAIFYPFLLMGQYLKIEYLNNQS